MQPTYAMEDMKVIMATATGIMLSYVQFIHAPTLNSMRWIVLVLTMLYTLRRWYLMEKRNKVNIKNSISNMNNWVLKNSYFGVPRLMYMILIAIFLGVLLMTVIN